MQGYSVQIAVKSTEYKVVDDLQFTPKLFPDCAYGSDPCLGPEADDQAELPPKDDVERTVDLEPLKNESVGLIAAAYVSIVADNDPFRALSELRQLIEDLPVTMAGAIHKLDSLPANDVIQRVRSDALRARSALPGFADAIFLNGHHFSAESLSQDFSPILSCLSAIADSGNALSKSLRILSPHSESLVPTILQSERTGSDFRIRLDVTSDGAFDDLMVWFNDLSKDRRYKKWKSLDFSNPNSNAWFLESVTNPSKFEAGLVPVRSNVLSLVLALDLGDLTQLGYLNLPESIVHGMIPLRLGMVFVPTNQFSVLGSAVFYYCLEVGGIKLANRYLRTLRQVTEYFGMTAGQIMLTESIIDLVYRDLSRGNELMNFGSAREIAESSESVRDRLRRNRKWAEELGIIGNEMNNSLWDPVTWDPSTNTEMKADRTDAESESASHARVAGFLNGIVLDDIGHDTLQVAVSEQKRLAARLQSGDPILLNSFQPGAPRWLAADQSLIFVKRLDPVKREEFDKPLFTERAPQPGQHFNFKHIPANKLRNHLEELAKIEYEDGALAVSTTCENSTRAERGRPVVTIWLVAKNMSMAGVGNAREAIKAMFSSGFAQNCQVRFAELTPESGIAQLITSNIAWPDAVLVLNGVIIPWTSRRHPRDLETLVAKELISHATSTASVLGVDSSGDAVLFGVLALRDIGVVCEDRSTSAQRKSHVPKLTDLEKIMGESFPSDLRISPLLINPSHASSQAGGPNSELSVVVAIDPLSKNAVPLVSFALELVNIVGQARVNLKVMIIPNPNIQITGKYAAQPVFTRYVLAATPVFGIKSQRKVEASAVFQRLPQDTLLTVGLVTPRPWFVAPFATNYDLDNVVLSKIQNGVRTLHGEFSLESLLVEGTCIDKNNQPPQGLRLQMVSNDGVSVDTIVMANLGYFQLKTPSPGLWRLELAPGRSRELFEIESISKFSLFGGSTASEKSVFSSDENGQIHVQVDSLVGARDTLLRVRRKPGTEGIPLLDPSGSSRAEEAQSDDSSVKSVIGRIYKPFTRPSRRNLDETVSMGPSDGKVHVFSVASGHLYERFLKIMMLSASKHSSVPVKFWILKNYLSPSFKKVIPEFASKHGFEVEMVTYRWPAWLREQTEKQRVIWAYKILFLDVLFPLNLSRVIFVDSDQVVRGDLAELMRMDLKGAPYGFVPFCDSRKEVDGFRFWKSGFWKETLRGEPYHISALYVVDLDAFRETSAGDSLRYIYQSLSADPNSLSNLDQDLPNYAAVAPVTGNVVPIFHLPPEWLWCESWCDDASKVVAKTIDLCNNPMTKEPKLASAKRIISEWVDLDDEATASTQEIHGRLSKVEAGDLQVSAEDVEEKLDRDEL